MRDFWDGLPIVAQEMLLLGAWLLPILLIGAALLYGFAATRLIRAMLWRFRWANLTFVVLIAVAVGMGSALIAQERGLRQGSAKAADKFDLLVTPPGSEMTMMLAAVYLQPSDVGLLDGPTYQQIARHERVEIAAPLAFGDSYRQSPVVGTTAQFTRHLTDDSVEGRLWETSHEAVVGAAAGLAIGESFSPSHGVGEEAGLEADSHDASFEVVGRMPRTGSPWDRAILVPVEAVWEVHGLANGHAPERRDQLGPPFDADFFPGTPAIIVKAEELWANYALRTEFSRNENTMAFFPATVLTDLYRVMGDVRQAMSITTLVTQMLVAASVLLALLILSRLFARQMALLRALGAPNRFLMAVVWGYCAVLILGGTLLGLGVGQGAASVLSAVITQRTDILVEARLGWQEFRLAAAFAGITLALAMLPALAVLRQPTVTHLRS